MSSEISPKRNITISLRADTVRKARILAAKRSTSVSGLLAEEIENLVAAEEVCESAERQALMLLEKGFHLGGIRAGRYELHER